MTVDPEFKAAYQRRPLLNAFVFIMWLGAAGFGIVAILRLLAGGIIPALPSAVVAFACLIVWYVVHNFALAHPKKGSR